MFPGHFKISGHSGTEFKNRKAFKKIKKANKDAVFKYGDEYGKKRFKVDKARMASVAEKKKLKLLKQGVLFVCLIFLSIVAANYFIKKIVVDLPPVIVKDKYDWKIHGSKAVVENIQNRQDSLNRRDSIAY